MAARPLRTERRALRVRRARRTARVLGVALLVAAIATAAAVVRSAQQSERAAAAPREEPVAAHATPLWSPRRIPGIVYTAAVRQHFARVIATFAAPGRCVAVDGPIGPLARVSATAPFAPASTEKLLTGAAALSVLGPDHVFTTRAEATASASGGVLRGDLYLVGGGDPVLATTTYRQHLAAAPTTAGAPTTALDDLAASIAATGVRRITGSIVADDSRYDAVRYPPALKPSERGVDLGPLGALSVDEGFGPNGVAAADPAVLAASSLATELAARGVVVAGPVRRGTTPPGARTVASIDSPRLDTIVESMLTVSDNYSAEMLVRAVGLAVEHVGSTGAGLRAVVASLGVLGVPTAGVALVDGSGLSPEDRVTCSALLAAVELGDRARLRALRAGLAVAGRTGTLAQRFVGDPLAGRLRAKTGHIDGVVGLAGIIPTGEGTVSFAFIANGGFGVALGEELQSRIAHLVARYPSIPRPDRFVPAPVP